VFTTVIVDPAKPPVVFAQFTENPIYGPSAENLSSPPRPRNFPQLTLNKVNIFLQSWQVYPIQSAIIEPMG
jgi:hypothetical protein